MADKEFNVKISAETDDFSNSLDKAEKDSSNFADTLENDVSKGVKSAEESLSEIIEELKSLQKEAIGITGDIKGLSSSMDETSSSANSLGDNVGKIDSDIENVKRSIKELRDELKGLQRDALGANASINGIGGSFSNGHKQNKKFNKEMQRLSMLLGGGVPESTKKAYSEMYKLHEEARKASRYYGKYSQQAMNARDAITKFALGLDDTTFKQIYMRSQLGLTEQQLRQQANSIKLNARMTKLMGNQTKILTERMKGLAKNGIKPEMMLPPSTIGQFQLLNETMEAGRSPLNGLSLGYRKLGGSVEKVIKNYSAQKVAIRSAQGDMVKYGLLLRGITVANMNMAMAFPIVGMAALFAYKAMFSAALEADKELKKLAETTKGKVLKALEPLIQTAGQFLKVALEVVGVVSDWISKFNEAHPVIAKILSVIGFLLPAMTLLLLPLQMGVGLWKGWMVSLNGVWTMFGGVVTMIGTASVTFLTFAGIIAAVAGAFIYLWNTNETFKNDCIVIWETIKTTISTALEFIKVIIQTGLEAIKQFWDTHGESINNSINMAYQFIRNIIVTALEIIKSIINLVLADIKAWWDKHGEDIKQAIKIAYSFIKYIIKSYLDAVSIFINTFIETVKSWWNKYGKDIQSATKTAWNIIKTLIKSALDIIQSIIVAITSAIRGDWDGFWNAIGNIVKTIWNTIKSVVKAGINSLPKIISAAKGLVISAIKGVLNGALNAAKSFGSKLLQVGKDLIKGLSNGIKSGASWVVKSITGAVKGAINAGKKLLGINSPSKLFRQFGEWTTEGYEIGVKRGEPSSTRAVEDFANNSINAFTDNSDILDNRSVNESVISNNNTNNLIDYNKMYEVMINAFSKAIENTGMNDPKISVDGRELTNIMSPKIARTARGW